MQINPLSYYQARLAAGEITPDIAQEKAVQALHDLALRLPQLVKKPIWPWARYDKNRGLYVYGTVGRGKTMLMDMFFETVQGMPKRRIHFHEFMLEVQKRLHDARRVAPKKDAVVWVASELAQEARLLCFDEFQVYNIADAMILSRFFRELFKRGVVVVATSNTAPEHLYKDGLQRILFLPFIELVKKRLHILKLDDGADYRQARLKGKRVYFYPLDAAAHHGMAILFHEMTDRLDTPPTDIAVEQGRTLHVPRSAHGTAWFHFDALCRQPRGAADFLAIVREFHSVFLEGVPFLKAQERDSALRFVHLVDVLYDHKVRLILSAEKPLEQLLDPTSTIPQFERTASRLMEMQSQDYILGAVPVQEAW